MTEINSKLNTWLMVKPSAPPVISKYTIELVKLSHR